MENLSLLSLRKAFGDKLQEHVSLAAYTSARIGGEADGLIVVNSADELAETISRLWEMEMPFFLLGGGSNLLISDAGYRGVVVLNKAKNVRFNEGETPIIWAESGVAMSRLSNQAASRGLSGLEWAANLPGTVGGAVYGNAGAFHGDMAGNLLHTEMLTRNGRETWDVEAMDYAYRSSALKMNAVEAVILSAELQLKNGDPAEIQETMRSFIQMRKVTQPPGATMGSTFKNPEGDYAGRLIEMAGLKGKRIGNAEISTVHANFIINHGETKASDVIALIDLVEKTVLEKFDVALELEIEIIGD